MTKNQRQNIAQTNLEIAERNIQTAIRNLKTAQCNLQLSAQQTEPNLESQFEEFESHEEYEDPK